MSDVATICPICHSRNCWRVETRDFIDGDEFSCANCGRFKVAGSASAELLGLSDESKALLSKAIWENHTKTDSFAIGNSILKSLPKSQFPDPAEQLDKLIIYCGRYQKSAGEFLSNAWGDLRAKLGARDRGTEDFIIAEAKKQQLIDDSQSSMSNISMRLTLLGWNRYHELERGQTHSRHAFMAMKFGDEELTKFVDDVFRPAVEETGFKLKRLDDAPKAGIIDHQLRVEIRQCKFLIADLTHANNGAYWEAGFAEGLGKHVIYTCRKDVFEDKERGTHFDTNHCTTIVWEIENPLEAANKLKATIRETFPFESKMPPEDVL